MRSFELLEHTADLGLRARGDSLGELLVACAEGLFSILVEEGEVAERTAVEMVVDAEGVEELVHGWLRELLFRFSAEGLAFARFELRHAEPTRLRATCHGEPVDPARHRGTEVKAVTWHGFQVRQESGRWTAEMFFDV